jgi:hypothetical protein
MINPMQPYEDAAARYSERLEEVAQARLAAQARAGEDAPQYRAARAVGRALLLLGSRLLRYGREVAPEMLAAPRTRTTQLN